MNVLAVLAVFFLGLIVMVALGGFFRVAKEDKTAQIIEGAVFALLGLLLAFSLSIAWSRHDVRLKLAVDEANALGTAAYRIDLVMPGRQKAMAQSMLAYARERVKYNEKLAGPDTPRTDALTELQLWKSAVDAVKDDNRPGIAQLVLDPVNQAIDLAAERTAEVNNPLPPLVILLIATLSLVAAFLLGRNGTGDRTALREGLVFAICIVLASYAILDLAEPRKGLTKISHTDEAFNSVVRRLEFVTENQNL